MWWQRKKKKKLEEAVMVDDLSIEQLSTMFNNVVWARQQISGLLTSIAEHQEDGHDCPPYCLPEGMGPWLSQLSPTAALILLTVMLKDAVLQEDTGDSENEDAL